MAGTGPSSPGQQRGGAVAPGPHQRPRPGNCITVSGNIVFIGAGAHTIYAFDSTPPPITNRPPVALPQNINLPENTPANFTLAGYDADGDALNFNIVPSRRGVARSRARHLTDLHARQHVIRLDSFSFTVDDGMATSAPVVINLAINAPANPLSTVTFTSPTNGGIIIGPANVTLTVAASNPSGINIVSFYSTSGTNLTALSSVTGAPYRIVLTNLAVGNYTFSANCE